MRCNRNGLVKATTLAVCIAAIVSFASGCVPVSASPKTGPETGSVQANGITIAYQSLGAKDRETVLLIAGTGQQLIDWPHELLDALVRRGYRVIIYDNRDTGLSTKFTAAGLPDSAAITKALQEGKPLPFPYSLRDMANDGVGLLDTLGVRKAHIAGISMGGAIAQLVAIDHPDHTLSLTLLMSNSGNPDIPVIAKPEAFAALPPPPAPDDKAAFVDYQVQTWKVLNGPGYPRDEKAIRELVQAGVDRSYDPAALVRQQTVSLLGIYDGGYRRSHLQDIQVPVVILQGTDDPIVPVESARDLAANIPGADLRLIPSLGHDIPTPLVPVFADAITAAARR